MKCRSCILPAIPGEEYCPLHHKEMSPVEAIYTKWSQAKKPNSALAEKDLRLLENDGYDISDPLDYLQAYRDTVREDYDDAEDYADDRASAWDEFVESIEGIEKY